LDRQRKKEPPIGDKLTPPPILSTTADSQSLAVSPAVWRTRVEHALRELSHRPVVLFTVLCAVNALSLPYLGLIHDARLYALQVMNRASGGVFSDDLFLRFGSQDQYTPFSLLAAPAARVFGVEWLFFLLFLVGNALLILATQRFIRTLIDDPLVSTAALLFLMMSAVPYGGLGVFHVHESFFTPRVLSCALALFGLEQTLKKHHGRGLALALIGTVVHPLMGFGAVLIGLACALLDTLPIRRFLAVLSISTAVGVVLVGYFPLGVRVFGTMDAAWLAAVRDASPYNFPGLWAFNDWLNLSLSVALPICVGMSWLRSSPWRARCLFVISAIGAAGLAATILAGHMPYRILLQGQPYRVGWILATIEIPLALVVATRLWQQGPSGRTGAILLVSFFGITNFFAIELAIPPIMFACLVLLRILTRSTRTTRTDTNWLARSLSMSIFAGFTTWGIVKVLFTLRLWPELMAFTDPIVLGMGLVKCFAPLLWLVPILMGLAMITRWHEAGRRLALGSAALALAVHSMMFLVPRVPAYREAYRPHDQDLAFAQRYLDKRYGGATEALTVYQDAWENVTYVWFDLRAKNYYDLTQVVGVLFSRDTAFEGERRAEIVRSFELERFRPIKRFMSASDKLMMEGIFKPERGTPAPTASDLARLCQASEPVDVAILKQEFRDMASATNGHISIYECANMRAGAR
jgi:hypothetical protein